MKNLKTLLAVCLAVLFGVAACKDDDKASTLTLSTNKVGFDAKGGTQTVNVTSNTDWVISTGSGWYNVAPSGASGNGTITITVEANTASAERTANVIVTSLLADINEEIIITQEAGKEEDVTTPKKLVETISYDDDELGIKFEYDTEGRIIKQTRYEYSEPYKTVTYSYDTDGQLVSSQEVSSNEPRIVNTTFTLSGQNLLVSEKYMDNGTLSFVDDYTLELDEKGWVSRWIGWEGEDFEMTFVYDEKGNVIKAEKYKNSKCTYRTEWTYDQNPSAFCSLHMPQWFFIINDIFDIKNNMKTQSDVNFKEGDEGNGSGTMTVTYDSDGYPTQSIHTYSWEGGTPKSYKTTYAYVK